MVHVQKPIALLGVLSVAVVSVADDGVISYCCQSCQMFSSYMHLACLLLFGGATCSQAFCSDFFCACIPTTNITAITRESCSHSQLCCFKEQGHSLPCLERKQPPSLSFLLVGSLQMHPQRKESMPKFRFFWSHKILLLVFIGCWSLLLSKTTHAFVMPRNDVSCTLSGASRMQQQQHLWMASKNKDNETGGGEEKANLGRPVISDQTINKNDPAFSKSWLPIVKAVLSFGAACALLACPAVASDSSSLLVGQSYWTIMDQGMMLHAYVCARASMPATHSLTHSLSTTLCLLAALRLQENTRPRCLPMSH